MQFDRATSLMILSALPGLGPVTIRKLDRAIPGGAGKLLELNTRDRRSWCSERVVKELEGWRRYFDPDKVFPELERMSADFVTFEDPDYPDALSPFADRPIGLYRCRSGLTLEGRLLAIVGTRQPSAYGRRVAREFATELSRRRFTIVSGLAEGIDTEAHRATLAAGGRTVAVLGGGLRRCYPLSNKPLLETIQDSGGAWTEFPLWRSADRRSFPQRNRIVAGISEAVLVVESGAEGGSLITARMAAEQGKSVYVVPGRIDAPESAGCHALIRDGAQLVTSVADLLEDLDYLPSPLGRTLQKRAAPATRPPPSLEGRQARIWDLLGEARCCHPDELASTLDEPVARISTLLLEMEIAGLVGRRLDGRYERA